MSERPVYVGVGTCACKRMDVRLYRAPTTQRKQYLLCAPCLIKNGIAPPKTRTADDIVVKDGAYAWKEESVHAPSDVLIHVGKMDLGSGHLFEVVLNVNEQLSGWLHTHPDARETGGILCQSFCAVRPLDGVPLHTVTSVDPLSLSPSLKCRTCGAHGDVTNGKWEPR